MRSLSTALACCVVLLCGLPALAVEPEAAAARLKALIEAQGATFTWSAVSGDSSHATIEGATVTREGEGGPIELGTVVMNGIAEASDGGLTVETLTTPGYSHTSGGATYEATGLEIGKLVLPDPAQGDAWMRFATMHMDAAKVTKRGRELFAASDIAYDFEMPQADGEPVAVTATAQRFSAEEHEGRSPIANDIADIMGIRSYAGSATAHAKWSPAQGDVELEWAELLLDDSGRLSLSFSGSGYTSDLLRSGQALDMNFGGGQSMEALMARGMAIFSVVSQVTFNGASVRFEPAPGVAPDPAAAKLARDRIARDLASFGKQFAAQSLAEIDAYIADPRSLEVRAAPPAPVNAATLTLGLMAAPKGLPRQLGLAIKANE